MAAKKADSNWEGFNWICSDVIGSRQRMGNGVYLHEGRLGPTNEQEFWRGEGKVGKSRVSRVMKLRDSLWCDLLYRCCCTKGESAAVILRGE